MNCICKLLNVFKDPAQLVHTIVAVVIHLHMYKCDYICAHISIVCKQATYSVQKMVSNNE